MKRLLAMILCVCCILTLVSCELPIREYKGTPICNLTYESIDYNGGYTHTYVIDFENNLINSTEISIGDLIDCLDLFYNLCSDNDITMIKETFSNNRKLIALMSKQSYLFSLI